jgi:ABC-type transport system substrate-binding protein
MRGRVNDPNRGRRRLSAAGSATIGRFRGFRSASSTTMSLSPRLSLHALLQRFFRPALALLLAVFAATAVAQAPAGGPTLRIASAFDPQTFDPHAIALLYHSRITHQVYESLVGRDENFKAEPALAASWSTPTPTTWRFKLRSGVNA